MTDPWENSRLSQVDNSDHTISVNSVSQNRSISFRALGLHTYLRSLPAKWNISSDRIAEDGVEGRDAIRKAMQELERAGLLRYVRTRTPQGTMRTDTLVYAKPWSEETAKPASRDKSSTSSYP